MRRKDKEQHHELQLSSKFFLSTSLLTSNKISPTAIFIFYSADILKLDLVTERPVWPLSSYGLKGDPCLIAGIDMFPEEMRWKAVQAAKEGSIEGYVSV